MSQEQEMSNHLDLLLDLAVEYGFNINGPQLLVAFFRGYLESLTASKENLRAQLETAERRLEVITDTAKNYGFHPERTPQLHEFLANKLREFQGMLTDRANSGVISVTEETWRRIGKQIDEAVTRALKAEAQVEDLQQKLQVKERALIEASEARRVAQVHLSIFTDLAAQYGYLPKKHGQDINRFLGRLLRDQTNTITELKQSNAEKLKEEVQHLRQGLAKIKNVITGMDAGLTPEEYERPKRQAEFSEATTKPPAKVWTSADLFLEEVTQMWQDENSNKPFRAPSPKDLLDWIREKVQMAEQVPEIIRIAHEAGWDGVNNSKILSFFLASKLLKKPNTLTQHDGAGKKHYYYECPASGCCGTFPVPAVGKSKVMRCGHCKRSFLVDHHSVTPAERRST